VLARGCGCNLHCWLNAVTKPEVLVDSADTAAEELCVIAASVALGREVATATLFCATKMIIIND